jgi:hypothetical protein
MSALAHFRRRVSVRFRVSSGLNINDRMLSRSIACHVGYHCLAFGGRKHVSQSPERRTSIMDAKSRYRHGGLTQAAVGLGNAVWGILQSHSHVPLDLPHQAATEPKEKDGAWLYAARSHAQPSAINAEAATGVALSAAPLWPATPESAATLLDLRRSRNQTPRGARSRRPHRERAGFSR